MAVQVYTPGFVQENSEDSVPGSLAKVFRTYRQIKQDEQDSAAKRRMLELSEQKSKSDLESSAFDRSAKTAELERKGFQIQPDGSVLRIPGYTSLEDQKIQSEIDKNNAEAKRKGSGDPYADELKRQRIEEGRRKTEEDAVKKTPEGRLKNLSGTDKQRFDNAKLALIATQGMGEALDAGQNTFRLPMTGDNDFTQQRALFEEALGRMQSGGAISVQESNRFKAMAPTAFDSPEIQQKKLEQLKSEMQSRLNTLGFTPDEAGVRLTAPKAEPQTKVMGGVTYKKVPGGWQQM